MGYERLDAQVRRQHGSSLAELVAAETGDAPFDPDSFREAVALNLHEGGEGQAPSVTMAFDVPEGVIQPCSIYTASEGSNGVAVNFEWMRRRPRVALSRVLDRLQGLPTVGRLREEIVAKDFAKRPTVPLSELTGDRMDLLLNALEALLDHPVEAAE